MAKTTNKKIDDIEATKSKDNKTKVTDDKTGVSKKSKAKSAEKDITTSKKTKVEGKGKASTTPKVENGGAASSKATGVNKATKSNKNGTVSKKKSDNISTDKVASTKKPANSGNKKSTTSVPSERIKDENSDKKSVSGISSNKASKSAKIEKPTKGAGELMMGLKEFEVQVDNINKVPILSLGNSEFIDYNSIKAILNIGTTQFTKRGIDLMSASGASGIVEYVNSYNNIMDARLSTTYVDLSQSEYVMTYIENIDWGVVVSTKTQVVRYVKNFSHIKNVNISSLVHNLYNLVLGTFVTVNNWIIYTDGTDLRFLGTTVGGNTVRAVSRISKPDFKCNFHKTTMAESTFKNKTMKITVPKNVLSGCIKGMM